MHNTSSPSVPPHNGASAAAKQPAEAPSLRADLDGLIGELEAATEGSPALDLRIHLGFRVAARNAPDLAALLLEQGVTWPTVEAVMEEPVPPYSTSLDAALDGENICFTLRSARRRRWAAMQRTAAGAEVLVWAATEPLARRLAALCVWRREMAEASAQGEPAPSSPPADPPPDEDREWEIAF